MDYVCLHVCHRAYPIILCKPHKLEYHGRLMWKLLLPVNDTPPRTSFSMSFQKLDSLSSLLYCFLFGAFTAFLAVAEEPESPSVLLSANYLLEQKAFFCLFIFLKSNIAPPKLDTAVLQVAASHSHLLTHLLLYN